MDEELFYAIRRIIVEAFQNQRPAKRCPMCLDHPIRADGKTCGRPECKQRLERIKEES